MPKPSPEDERALAHMRRVYGVKTNAGLLAKSLEIALRAAKFAKEMGIEPSAPTHH